MNNPKTIRAELTPKGYYLELETSRRDCSAEYTPHWHLYLHGLRIGQISAYGNWTQVPGIKESIIKEAERVTAKFSQKICEFYAYNAKYGSER